MMRCLVVVIALLLLPLPDRGQTSKTETYVIAGVVVNGTDGQPAKRIRVAIAPSGVPGRRSAMTTADNGRFRFDGVPAGKYRLTADTPAGVQYVFGETPGTGFGIAIVTGKDQRTDDLVFRLLPRAAIHGRIVDQNGDGVENALVQLVRSAVVNGRRLTYYYDYRYTDDHGEYRFFYLPPGTWFLLATGRPWYTDRVQSTPSSPLAQMGYPAAFYPGSRDPRAASPLRLEAGQDLTADFTLTAAPGGTLVVSVGKQSKAVRVQVTFEGVGGSRCWERVETIYSEGRFGGLPPGRYTVRASTTEAGRETYGEQSVVVGTGETKIELTLSQQPSVSGILALEGSSKVPDGMVVLLQSEETARAYAREIGTDGVFRFEALVPGLYRPVIVDDSSRRSLPIRGLLLDGVPAKSQTLDLSKPIVVEIAAASGGGGVSGFVYRNGVAAPGTLVVLAPSASSANPFDYRGFQTDSDASFEFENIPPGDYVLFAVKDLAEFEYTNPEVVRPRFASGQRLRIEKGNSQSIRLELQ